VHCFLDLVAREYTDEAKKFIADHCVEHEQYHDLEIRELMGITTPDQMASSDLVSALRNRRYTLQLCSYSQELFLAYLMEHKFMALLGIVNQHIELAVLSGKPSVGQQNVGLGTASDEVEMLNKKEVYWGQLKQPAEVEEALEDDEDGEDEGKEDGEDDADGKAKKRAAKRAKTIPSGAASDRVPLPPASGRELQMKIEQLKEIRKRVELGASKLPSACLYTFFNATDRVHSLTMSEDATLIAAGFADSYIKIWSLDSKKPLRTLQPSSQLKNADVIDGSKLEDFLDDQPEQSKTLIGHCGPVYETSFSPDNSHLVSCSEDGTVRLWNLHTWTNVVCYKGHMNPVWSVQFSPLGYYFATASHDRTARLWSTDHIYPLRLFAGHLSDVDVVKFHPNTNYIATGSSDKSCRLWDVTTGECVRVFEGHAGTVHALAFSGDGQYLVSGGDDCNLFLWNLGSGKRMAVFKGHRDVIYSVSFSGDGTLIASGSADKTLRLWAAGEAVTQAEAEATPGESSDVTAEAAAKTFELAAFPTKSTPIMSTMFSRRNMLFAAGLFNPNT
jgi:transcription initiation factor TFIID subunit 5